MDSKTGRPIKVTTNEHREWMNQCVESFVSQLLSATQATDPDQTPTVRLPLSLIASSVPLDDSRKWITQIHVICIEVDSGDEGADIAVYAADNPV